MKDRRFNDLKAREALTAENLADHLRAANLASNPADRSHHDAMAQVERERLQQIRIDLAE
jgi:hypothetical protein